MFKSNFANVYKLLLGRVATNIADSLFYMAILWYFKEVFHSPIAVSIIFAISSGIDVISFSFGPLIDRVSIKKLLEISTTCQVVGSLATISVLILNIYSLYIELILIILFAVSTIASEVIYPAESKLLPLFVPKKDLIKFNGLFQITYHILDLLLDASVTIIITVTSVSDTFILSGLVFALAFIFYRGLEVKRLAKDVLNDDEYFTGSYLKDISLGIRILRKEKNIINLILPLAITNFFYGIFAVGLPYFAQSYIHDSVVGYGELLFASSLGSILGAYLVQYFKLNTDNMQIFVAICFLGAGIFRIMVPLLINLNVIVLLIASAFSSAWITMMNINFEALVQISFSSAVLGRVQTINESILSIMIPIGTLFGGWVVKYVGSLSTQYIYGIALLSSSIFYFFYHIRH